ncbi:MAG: hypothetical protein K2P81_11380 [Bacteriovoracaceae bacterium]|nr:hypothetical protein [Bacteriovoracaceae bacterium]
MKTEEFEKSLRESQKAVLRALYPQDYSKLKEAAKFLGIPFENARQAYQYGKGSTFTINGLILFALGIKNPQQLKSYLPKLRESLGNPRELSPLESLIEEARSFYSEKEIEIWITLLLAKKKIELEKKPKKKK